MQIVLTTEAKEHLNYWKKSGNKTILNKIEKLTDSIFYTPYKGLGKPEQLKHNLSGCWSRRINQEHRLVYKVTDDSIRHVLRFLEFKSKIPSLPKIF